MEVIELDTDFGSTFSGVLTDDRGRVQAIWGSFSTQALVKKDPVRRQVLRVKGCLAGSKAEHLLEQGDMILVIKKEPITCFRDIERACQELDMSEESAGELTMTIFWDKKLNLLWELMLEMAMAQQEWLIGVDVLFKILTQQCEHLVFFRKKGMVCMWQGYLIQQKKKWLKDGTAKSWDEALVSYFRERPLTNITQLTVTSHAFHPKPFQFKNLSSNGSTLSFSTTFVFAIVPKYSDLSGPGICFVIAPSRSLPGALPTQYLGLFNYTSNGDPSNHVVAVELDTIVNKEFGDINDNHVGIDLNNLRSAISAPAKYYLDRTGGNYKNLSLISGQQMQVWIEYAL
ncbi:hypothetical protein IFM89_012453 [Coptis chinensis]|uniref:Legume lectin domain-containing protein n=1 Tax=Coptis chinensis TaxID=261450 RepID=A0A835I9C7_9MAGN|nr:hypothetical protein IFM89_012453 [Coptis chinensis]